MGVKRFFTIIALTFVLLTILVHIRKVNFADSAKIRIIVQIVLLNHVSVVSEFRQKFSLALVTFVHHWIVQLISVVNFDMFGNTQPFVDNSTEFALVAIFAIFSTIWKSFIHWIAHSLLLPRHLTAFSFVALSVFPQTPLGWVFKHEICKTIMKKWDGFKLCHNFRILFFSTYLYCTQNIGTGLVQHPCDCHQYEPRACTCTWTFLHSIDKNNVYLSNVLSTCACKVGDCCMSWNRTCHKQCSDFVCQFHEILWCGFSVKNHKVTVL